MPKTKKLRTALANCLSFTTARKSIDMTFAAASKGPDLDPDIEVVARRAAALRRGMAKSDHQRMMAKDIFEGYKARGEPGCYRDHEDLKHRVVAGEPGSPQRARLRKRCRPLGPIWFLLESMLFLQAAAVDGTFTIKQWNQADMSIWDSPYQHLKPMIQ